MNFSLSVSRFRFPRSLNTLVATRMGRPQAKSGKLRRTWPALHKPLPPPSPRKPSAGRERIYSAPGESNAPLARRVRHCSHAQPRPDRRRPLRSSPCSTHERSVANFSASESVSPVCVVGRFPPLPTPCASTDSPTNPLKGRLTARRSRLPAAFPEISHLPMLTATTPLCDRGP